MPDTTSFLRRRVHLAALRTVLALVLLWSSLVPHRAQPTQASPRLRAEVAQSADAFVDSLCVATHWGYTDRAYSQRYLEVRQKLVDSGIRNVRDGLYRERPQELGALGLRMTIIADLPNGRPGQPYNGDERDIAAIVTAVAAANANGARIDAIEGPNEPDLFWAPTLFNKTYKGQGFPAGIIAFQRDLYRAVKSNPATASLRVIGPSLGVTYDPGGGRPNPFAPGSLTDAVDWGNFHPYPGGNPFNNPANSQYGTIERYYWHSNFPSVNIGTHPFALDVAAPPFAPKPLAATETGYSTYSGWVGEEVHAKYMPRLFLEYFRAGIKRTCSYELLDEVDDPNDREANFGLLRYDLSPKPAYTALQQLTALLSDPGPTFAPRSLSYTLVVSPVLGYKEPLSGIVSDYDRTEYVHHLLLQKRDGRFFLVLWH